MPRTAVLDCNILKKIYRTHDIKSVLIVGATYRINLLEYCSASNRGFDQDARRKITVYMIVRSIGRGCRYGRRRSCAYYGHETSTNIIPIKTALLGLYIL